MVPWEQGRLTDLSNLALLCRRHHGLVRGNDWVLEAVPLDSTVDRPASEPGAARSAVRLLWHAPDGRIVEGQDARGHRRRPAA